MALDSWTVPELYLAFASAVSSKCGAVLQLVRQSFWNKQNQVLSSFFWACPAASLLPLPQITKINAKRRKVTVEANQTPTHCGKITAVEG